MSFWPINPCCDWRYGSVASCYFVGRCSIDGSLYGVQPPFAHSAVADPRDVMPGWMRPEGPSETVLRYVNAINETSSTHRLQDVLRSRCAFPLQAEVFCSYAAETPSHAERSIHRQMPAHTSLHHVKSYFPFSAPYCALFQALSNWLGFYGRQRNSHGTSPLAQSLRFLQNLTTASVSPSSRTPASAPALAEKVWRLTSGFCSPIFS